MGKRLAALLLALLTLTGKAEAAGEWLNFCPDDWNHTEPVHALAQTLAEEAETRREIPRLVHDWVCENLYYDEDAYAEGVYNELAADEVLYSRKGVCESFANLVQSLLLEAGIPCAKVWGCAIPEGASWEDAEMDLERINHTWNVFFMDGAWHSMDCTMDMGNRYQGGLYYTGRAESNFYAPEEDWFGETHRVLQRGSDPPENIPDAWAQPELREAVSRGYISLALFRDYRAAVTEREMYTMLGLPGGADTPVTRAQAAVLIARRVALSSDGTGYKDTEHNPESGAIAALRAAQITAGTGGGLFSPARQLTREEAIVMTARLYRKEDSCT